MEQIRLELERRLKLAVKQAYPDLEEYFVVIVPSKDNNCDFTWNVNWFLKKNNIKILQ